jgi:hypothetical protein
VQYKGHIDLSWSQFGSPDHPRWQISQRPWSQPLGVLATPTFLCRSFPVRSVLKHSIDNGTHVQWIVSTWSIYGIDGCQNINVPGLSFMPPTEVSSIEWLRGEFIVYCKPFSRACFVHLRDYRAEILDGPPKLQILWNGGQRTMINVLNFTWLNLLAWFCVYLCTTSFGNVKVQQLLKCCGELWFKLFHYIKSRTIIIWKRELRIAEMPSC